MDEPSPNFPFTTLGSPQARAAWDRRNAWRAAYARERAGLPEASDEDEAARLAAWLRHYYDEVYLAALEEKHRECFPVEIAAASIAGVPVEIFMPGGGVASARRGQVLINLHGGSFTGGRRLGGRVESIPIAARAGIKVVSIDYRLFPEVRFPAATEDVITVYTELLKSHPPDQIGLFGCSAGGMLVAQAIASMIAGDMPRPAAAAMICGTGELFARGDSAMFVAALNGQPPAAAEIGPGDRAYLKDAVPSDPLLFPMRHPAILAKFPPSLLISGTRAYDFSSMIDAHRKLIKAGVDADLHLWEGAMHAFFFDPELPEAQDAYDVIARFFHRRLIPG